MSIEIPEMDWNGMGQFLLGLAAVISAIKAAMQQRKRRDEKNDRESKELEDRGAKEPGNSMVDSIASKPDRSRPAGSDQVDSPREGAA